MQLIPHETELERLRHQVVVLELEKQRYKLKAKTMAVRLSYLESLYKRIREARHD